MNPTPDQIAEAFCSYRFAETYPYMADGIRWNIVNRESLIGREAVMAQCDKAAEFLQTVSATITRLDVLRGETFVVVEGAARIQDRENNFSKVASCDIFQFSGERLVEITSYVIDINKA